MLRLKENIFLAKRYLLNKSEWIQYKELVNNENSLNAEELNNLNLLKRIKLVNFCLEHNDFYIKKYNEFGIKRGDIKSDKDFQNIPILEKDEIRNNSHFMFSNGYEISNLDESTTGGTTGAPLSTYREKSQSLTPISWRALKSWGISPSANAAYLYRSVPNGINRIYQKLLLWPTSREWMSATQMTRKNMNQFYMRLLKQNTEYLVGYVGALDSFANYLYENNLTLPNVKVVWSTASVLTDAKRKFLEKIFNCNVYNQYGSCEFYWIAAECKQKSGLHIASDQRHVEIVTENSLQNIINSYGDILVSDLENYAFPLIRYRLGDRGKLINKECGCGSLHPRLESIKGRTTDNIMINNIESIPGEFWTTIFDDYPKIVDLFNVHQLKNFEVIINFKVHKNIDESAIELMCKNISKKVDNRLQLNFKQVDNIPIHNGKFKFVTSDLS